MRIGNHMVSQLIQCCYQMRRRNRSWSAVLVSFYNLN
jgi:hypothetical protein